MTTLQPPLQSWISALSTNTTYYNGSRTFPSDIKLDFSNLDDHDTQFTRGPLIKSTSLKTTREPKGEGPQRRKSVRFADALGLDLENVRLIHGGQPTIPASAFLDLKVESDYDGIQCEFKHRPITQLPPWNSVEQQKEPQQPPTNKSTLVPEFVQPFTLIDFLDRVRNQKVCLENCMVTRDKQNCSTTCVVRVANISYFKKVFIRYTTDSWKSYCDAEGNYLANASDSWSDRFICKFSIKLETSSGVFLMPGQRVMFAICYLVEGSEHWDNNCGANYSLIYHL